jgi:trehalose/maltose transport system substrate-binding protein
LNFPHGWSFRSDDLTTRAALSEQFTRETGIQVRDIPVPESTFEQLVLFRSLLQKGSSGLDLFAIDIIWTELLQGDLVDLRTYLSDEIGLVKPQLLPSYSVDQRVLAIPFEVNVGSLEYRTDLLREYGYDHPPATWDELEAMATRIQAGERVKGRADFWGFVWQGAAAEALTCNALEWQVAEGGGRIVESDRTISVNNPAAIRAWQRARGWIGRISPPAVVAYRERDSMNVFDAGRAAFNRVWLGTSNARSGPFSQVHWRSLEPKVPTGFTSIPGGPRGWAGTLGGSGLSVSRRSIHPKEAVKLVQFLIHAQIDSIQKMRTESPNQPEFFNIPVSDQADGAVQGTRVVHRPSVETGSKYPEVSEAYVAAVHAVLTGDKAAPEAAAELERHLAQITGYRPGTPKR